MIIVFKCEDENCKHPDAKLADPVDDHVYCACGKMKRGHFRFKAKSDVLPCGWCGSTDYTVIDNGWDWPYTSCCGGN